MARTLVGFVASDKNHKTISVRVDSHKVHPIYKKKYISSKKYLVHDEKNEAARGDRVQFSETRPLSAKKRFRLDKILEVAPVEHVEEEQVLEKAKE
ncbi:MAG TPA: 30S ribosomal protein S17 [Candidatus Saccharimonadales bacterium]|nr:30S ribosomal protein S17 [Candidatus Saccharimonadales bacterium]